MLKYINDNVFQDLNYNFIINYNGTINEWGSINFAFYWMGTVEEIKVICTDGTIIETPNTPRANEIYYTSIDGNIIDVDTMEYRETVMINSQLILEAVFGGSDISRIIAEISSMLAQGD